MIGSRLSQAAYALVLSPLGRRGGAGGSAPCIVVQTLYHIVGRLGSIEGGRVLRRAFGRCVAVAQLSRSENFTANGEQVGAVETAKHRS